jgi:hypothetical protein
MLPMSLRIVACNVMPHAYAGVERHGHEIVMLVTAPLGTVERYGVSYLELVEIAAPRHQALVTTDLLISASFSHGIPRRVTEMPRYGAYNLHPAPLPRGRGPNHLRLISEEADTAGATLHQISPDLDGGANFSRREAPSPESLSGARSSICGVCSARKRWTKASRGRWQANQACPRANRWPAVGCRSRRRSEGYAGIGQCDSWRNR